MIKKFENKKFRQAFVAANVRRGIAYQLRAMRGSKTQAQTGKIIGKPQNVISRLEDPRYGKVSVQTLLEVAAAYDVALLVKFVPYGRLIEETKNLSQEVLVPLSFDAEQRLRKYQDVNKLSQQYKDAGGMLFQASGLPEERNKLIVQPVISSTQKTQKSWKPPLLV